MDETLNKKESTITREEKAGFGFQLLVIFLFLAIGIGISGYHYYKKQTAHLREAANNQLGAIADLKVTQVSAWRNERIEDATTLLKALSFVPFVSQWLKHPADSNLKQEVSAWMKIFLEEKNCQAIILADVQGNTRLSLPQENNQLNTYDQQEVREALQTKKIIFTDFFLDETTRRIHLDLVIPLFTLPENEGVPFGVIVLEIDPYQLLYPLIQTWPTPSKTAEALLVRREGTEVVFLNELRHRKNTALKLRFPISRKDLPAAMVVRGTVGIIEGNDYRGVPVLATVQKIPDSPWFLVSKIDQQEVYGLIKKQSRFVAIFFALLIALSGAGLALLWRQQSIQFYKKQHQADIKSIKSQEDLSRAQAVGNIGSWRLDVRRNELTWSDENHRIFGIPKGTPMAYETFFSTVHPDDRDYVDTKWKEGLAGKPYDIEHRIIVNGHVKWVREKAYLEFDSKGGALVGGFGITQDITARKEMENAIRLARDELEIRVQERTAELKGVAEALQDEMAERKQAEEKLKATNALLSLFSQKPSRKEYLDAVVDLIHSWTGYRCVGIRILDDKGYIPYESYIGFSREFWESESRLSIEHAQCVCMRVITGNPDPQDVSMMTPGGSFHCEDTVAFVGRLSAEEKARFRGVCIQNGFLSLSIVPVRYGDKILGSIQLADEERKKLSLPFIEFLELMSPLIGEAINRFNLEDEIRESESHLRFLSSQLLTVQEDERKRISAELHDDIAAKLAAIKFTLEKRLMQTGKATDEATQSLKDIISMVVRYDRIDPENYD